MQPQPARRNSPDECRTVVNVEQMPTTTAQAVRAAQEQLGQGQAAAAPSDLEHAVNLMLVALDDLTAASDQLNPNHRRFHAPSLFIDALHPDVQLAVLRAAASDGAVIAKEVTGPFVMARHPQRRWTVRAHVKAVCDQRTVVEPVSRTEYSLPDELVHHMEPPC